MGAYSQYFILFVTQEQAQYVRVFVTGKPFQLSGMEQSSLLGQLVSYEENGVLWIIRYLIFLSSCLPTDLKTVTFVSLAMAATASLVFSMYVGNNVKMSNDSWANVARASELN